MTAKAQNILFLVTGMTPAIITETIWALACDPNLDEDSRWIPDRVEVLSTEHGLNQIHSRLLENKVIEQLKQDFRSSLIWCLMTAACTASKMKRTLQAP